MGRGARWLHPPVLGANLTTTFIEPGDRVRRRMPERESAAEAREKRVERLDAAKDLQYGGDTFTAASRYLRGLLRSGDRAWFRWLRAVRDISGLRALIRELRGLETVPVRLSQGESGQSIARHLAESRHRLVNNRVAQGVMLLPPTFADYTRGRARQALRTNIRAAAAEGITCTALPRDQVESTFAQWSEQDILPRALAPEHSGMVYAPRDARWYVALDLAGKPLAAAAVCIDTEWALLCGLVAVSHPARWLLHTHVVEELYEAGARNLCVHSAHALLLEPNLQYLQQRLGYRVAHLRVDRS